MTKSSCEHVNNIRTILQQRADEHGKLTVDVACEALQASEWWQDMRYAQQEMEAIAATLEEARQHSAGLSTNDSQLDQANKELDAVLQTTEDAANKIMDAAEAIQEAVGAQPIEHKEVILTLASDIIMACSRNYDG